MNFDGATLLISARSPFARRVRLAFLEHGLHFEERVFDVFKANPELQERNPLARVPTLILPGGEVLVDSNLILELFYRETQSPFPARQDTDPVNCRFWSAMAIGASEKCVEYYMEKLRPESHRDGELLAEIEAILERVLGRFDQFIGNRATIASAGLTQADLDMGTTLAYISLRYTPTWTARFPNAERYFSALDERPSFQKTRPPAA